ncbi:MAG: RidA family protein [Myxococcota bacterium]
MSDPPRPAPSSSSSPSTSSRVVQPPGWPRPRGYSNGMAARGEVLAIAGQIGWDERETLVSIEFLPQFEQALRNVAAVLEAAGGQPEHLISLTLYVTDKHQYLAAGAALGKTYRAVLGKHYPAMALVQVAALLEDGALVEIQGLAVLPDPPTG